MAHHRENDLHGWSPMIRDLAQRLERARVMGSSDERARLRSGGGLDALSLPSG